MIPKPNIGRQLCKIRTPLRCIPPIPLRKTRTTLIRRKVKSGSIQQRIFIINFHTLRRHAEMKLFARCKSATELEGIDTPDEAMIHPVLTLDS